MTNMTIANEIRKDFIMTRLTIALCLALATSACSSTTTTQAKDADASTVPSTVTLFGVKKVRPYTQKCCMPSRPDRAVTSIGLPN